MDGVLVSVTLQARSGSQSESEGDTADGGVQDITIPIRIMLMGPVSEQDTGLATGLPRTQCPTVEESVKSISTGTFTTAPQTSNATSPQESWPVRHNNHDWPRANKTTSSQTGTEMSTAEPTADGSSGMETNGLQPRLRSLSQAYHVHPPTSISSPMLASVALREPTSSGEEAQEPE